jgi:hypothetical protein
MTGITIQRIDLAVESLRQAENFYRSLFQMKVAYREAADGDRTVRLDGQFTWEEIIADGCRIRKSVLGDESFQIAVCSAASDFSRRSRLELIVVGVECTDISQLTCAAGDLGCEFLERDNGRVRFRDPYGICWEITVKPDAGSLKGLKSSYTNEEDRQWAAIRTS